MSSRRGGARSRRGGALLTKAAAADARDDYGRVVVVERDPKPSTDLLVLGRNRPHRWRGFGERLNTEEVAAIIRQADGGDFESIVQFTGEMQERDPSLSAVMQTRVFAPIGLPRVWLPATLRNGSQADLDRADDIADECAEMVDQINELDSWLVDFFDAIGRSISVSEILYRTDGSIERFRWVNPANLYYDDDEFLCIRDLGPDGFEKKIRIAEFPWKFVIHRAKARSGHPARGGILRAVIWPYVFRNYALRDWSVFLETFGMPIRIGKYSPGATDKDKAQLSAMLEHLSSDAWAIISEKTTIEFKEIVQRSAEPYTAFYRAMQGEYALGVLGQTATNLVNEFGTRGDSAVKGLVRQDILENDCSQGESTFRRDVLYPFVAYRHGTEIANRFTPTYHFSYEPPVDYAAQAVVDRTVLIELGVGKNIPRRVVAARYGWGDDFVADDDPAFAPEEMVVGPAPEMPEPDDEEEDDDEDENEPENKKLLGSAVASSASIARLDRAFRGELAKKFREAKVSSEQKAVDGFVDNVLTRADEAFLSLADPVKAIIAQSEDLRDLQLRLRNAYPELDRSKLEGLIGKALFAARLYGRATINDRVRKKTRKPRRS